VATHGFFAVSAFQEEQRRAAHYLDSWQFRAGSTTGAAGLGVRNPLSFSGLVCAGANHPEQAGRDGGILTGEVLISLPLEKLHLVVLSACQTGLGVEADGECVYGLQRAFHVAGCKNVVASLWNVPDEPTAALMALFYDALLRQKKSPLEALRQAQLAIYRDPQLAERVTQEVAAARDRGSAPDFSKVIRRPKPAAGTEPVASTGRTPPKAWAGFVLSGLGR
jgi:CHAT domain-containing protein